MYRTPGVADIIFDELFSVLCNNIDVSLLNNFVLIGDFNVNLVIPILISYCLSPIGFP